MCPKFTSSDVDIYIQFQKGEELYLFDITLLPENLMWLNSMKNALLLDSLYHVLCSYPKLNGRCINIEVGPNSTKFKIIN